MSCAKNVMSQLMLKKSDINNYSRCHEISTDTKLVCHNILEKSYGRFSTLETKKLNLNSSECADLLLYTAVCDMCEGYGSSISAYHLKYSSYIQSIKDSWSQGVSASLSEIQAFSSSSKVLIVSGLDYMNFKDFESQTMLVLLESRAKPNLSTVLTINSIDNLTGSGPFFTPLKDALKGGKRFDNLH